MEHCGKHYPWKSEGWAPKIQNRRRGKVPAKFQDGAEAPEDEGESTTESVPKPKRPRVNGASNAKQRRGGGASKAKKTKKAKKQKATKQLIATLCG